MKLEKDTLVAIQEALKCRAKMRQLELELELKNREIERLRSPDPDGIGFEGNGPALVVSLCDMARDIVDYKLRAEEDGTWRMTQEQREALSDYIADMRASSRCSLDWYRRLNAEGCRPSTIWSEYYHEYNACVGQDEPEK